MSFSGIRIATFYLSRSCEVRYAVKEGNVVFVSTDAMLIESEHCAKTMTLMISEVKVVGEGIGKGGWGEGWRGGRPVGEGRE